WPLWAGLPGVPARMHDPSQMGSTGPALAALDQEQRGPAETGVAGEAPLGYGGEGANPGQLPTPDRNDIHVRVLDAPDLGMKRTILSLGQEADLRPEPRQTGLPRQAHDVIPVPRVLGVGGALVSPMDACPEPKTEEGIAQL